MICSQRNSAFSDGRALPQEPPSTGRPGGVLGYATDFDQQYVLENEIGSGSFGTVYGATAVADSEQVAVKVRCRAGGVSSHIIRDMHTACGKGVPVRSLVDANIGDLFRY